MRANSLTIRCELYVSLVSFTAVADLLRIDNLGTCLGRNILRGRRNFSVYFYFYLYNKSINNI